MLSQAVAVKKIHENVRSLIYMNIAYGNNVDGSVSVCDSLVDPKRMQEKKTSGERCTENGENNVHFVYATMHEATLILSIQFSRWLFHQQHHSIFHPSVWHYYSMLFAQPYFICRYFIKSNTCSDSHVRLI